MSALDIVILAVIAGAVALAVVRLVRNRRQGKGTCGCGCANCPSQCGKRRP